MNFPELASCLGREFRQVGGAFGVRTTGDGKMPKDVPHSLAETASQPFNDLMNCMTVRARIAAVLNESHLGIGRTQNMVALHVNHRVSISASYRAGKKSKTGQRNECSVSRIWCRTSPHPS